MHYTIIIIQEWYIYTLLKRGVVSYPYIYFIFHDYYIVHSSHHHIVVISILPYCSAQTYLHYYYPISPLCFLGFGAVWLLVHCFIGYVSVGFFVWVFSHFFCPFLSIIPTWYDHFQLFSLIDSLFLVLSSSVLLVVCSQIWDHLNKTCPSCGISFLWLVCVLPLWDGSTGLFALIN